MKAENDKAESELNQFTDDVNAYKEQHKETIIKVQMEFQNMSETNGIEDSKKKQELRKEYENLLDLKNKNKLLEQQLHDRRRELFTIEVSFLNDFQIRTNIKKLAIRTLRELTRLKEPLIT